MKISDAMVISLFLLFLFLASLGLTWYGWLSDQSEWWNRLITVPYKGTHYVFALKTDDPRLLKILLGWLGSTVFYFLAAILICISICDLIRWRKKRATKGNNVP